MNESDKNNPRRLIRAIETSQKKPSSVQNTELQTHISDWLLIYLYSDKKNIYEKIDMRINKRLKEGILDEIQNLLNKGYNFDLPSFSAIPYRLFKSFFSDGQSKEELEIVIEKWKLAEHSYARRQITWFNKMIGELPQNKVLSIDINNKVFTKALEARVGKWYTE